MNKFVLSNQMKKLSERVERLERVLDAQTVELNSMKDAIVAVERKQAKKPKK